MKGLVFTLLLLDSCAFVLQQQIDGGLSENEISQQNRRAEASADGQQYCHVSFTDIHAALRELTASVTEQKTNIRALETRLKEQQTFILEELNKKTDALDTRLREQQTFILEELSKSTEEVSNLTQSQVEELRKDTRDREIAFSASLFESGNSGNVGPFTTNITLTYRDVLTNIGNAYNPVTGVFTAPLKGAYMFRISAYANTAQKETLTIFLMKNDRHAVIAHGDQDQGVLNSSNGAVLVLEAGDVVYVRLRSGSRIYDDQNNHSTFSGYLLFPLREQELCRM